VSDRASRATGLAVVVLLLALAGWSVAALQPPTARPADAPGT